MGGSNRSCLNDVKCPALCQKLCQQNFPKQCQQKVIHACTPVLILAFQLHSLVEVALSYSQSWWTCIPEVQACIFLPCYCPFLESQWFLEECDKQLEWWHLYLLQQDPRKLVCQTLVTTDHQKCSVLQADKGSELFGPREWEMQIGDFMLGSWVENRQVRKVFSVSCKQCHKDVHDTHRKKGVLDIVTIEIIPLGL